MIFDGHSDIWTDVTKRVLNGENDILRKYHLSKLREGKISGSIFVIWIDPPYTDNSYARSMQIVDSIKKELKYCRNSVVIAKSYNDIEKAIVESKFYILIGLEGLSSIGENLDLIDFYYDFGVRHASLTWNEENALATGAKGSLDKGLTELGKKAVKIINQKNMLLDVSHLNDKSFWDVVNVTDKPIISSHSNCSSQETSYTKGLEDSSKTYNIIIELERSGFSNEEIEKIAYKNFHRIIRNVIK